MEPLSILSYCFRQVQYCRVNAPASTIRANPRIARGGSPPPACRRCQVVITSFGLLICDSTVNLLDKQEMSLSFLDAESLARGFLDTLLRTPTGKLPIAETDYPSTINKANAVSEAAIMTAAARRQSERSERQREWTAGAPRRRRASGVKS